MYDTSKPIMSEERIGSITSKENGRCLYLITS